MTKLNYVNRKSTGVKLGQIVQKDLKKRLTASSSKYDSSSPLDLGLGGKDLTDEGVEAFASTLAQTLASNDGSTVTRLQILHLQGNRLTVRSLAQLAPVIQAASTNLEDLDLADNQISVASPDDIIAWETFLSAFAGCNALRRVSLAGNDLSNPTAFESLSRVYLYQFSCNMPVLSINADYTISAENDLDDVKDDINILSVRDLNQHDDGPGSARKKSSVAQINHEVFGLPCIQVVDLSNVSLTEAGALFLSWVIERHRWVQGAMFHRKWGTHRSNDANISTGDSPKMTKTATKLLVHAETLAYHPFDLAEDGEQAAGALRQEDASLNESRRASGISTHSRQVSDYLSVPACVASSPGTKDVGSQEFNALRGRIQRNIIEEQGLSKVRLWATAIRLLCAVRRVMVDDRPSDDHRLDSEVTYALAAAQRLPTTITANGRRRTSSVSSAGRDRRRQSSMSAESPRLSYAAKLTAGKNGANSPSSAPRTPQVLRVPRVRDRKDSQTASTTERSDSAVDTLEPFATRVLRYMAPPPPCMAGALPIEVWSEVLYLQADPKHILSDRQRRAVVAHGKSRETLRHEIEALGKARSTQIWLVLERMGCLMYDDSE